MRIGHNSQIEVEFEAISRHRWRVWQGNEVLCANTRDPEFDACRSLHSRGIGGTLCTRHRGSSIIAMVLDIEKASKWAAYDVDRAPHPYVARATQSAQFETV